MEMGIYIGQMWRQIIFTQFIESDYCNFALKLVLCRKLIFFFFIPTFPMTFYIHPYQFKACKVINVYKFFKFY